MIEMNKEYKYQDICNELGWNATNGNSKIKRIKCIEESFEFYHPMNKKTKKPKKSYVFTRMIKEPVLIDNRVNNGGYREGSGRKDIFSDKKFDYIWEVFCKKCYKINCYYEREYKNDIFFTHKFLYKFFGFDCYGILNRIKYTKEKEYYFVGYKFKEIVLNTIKSRTILKLCKRYDFKLGCLPKSILRAKSKDRWKEMIFQDDLLPIYDKWLKEELNKQGFKNEGQAVMSRKYLKAMDNVKDKFEIEKNICNVKKCSYIRVDDIDFESIDNDICYNTIRQYRDEFREIILNSIKKSVTKRIEDNGDKYNMILDDKAKELFQSYLSQLCDIACFVTSENIDNVNQDMLLEMDITAALSEEENLIFDIV